MVTIFNRALHINLELEELKMLSIRKLSPTITNMIRLDHTHAFTAFHQYSQDKSPSTKKALANTICLALEIHAQLEEATFYPALKEVIPENETLKKSLPEHNELKVLITKLRNCNPEEANFDAIFMELMRDTIHHVAEEETTLLPLAEKVLGNDRLRELGAEMTKLRLKLMKLHAREITVDTVKGFKQSPVFWMGSVLAATMCGYMIKNAFARK
jgi:hemerythrin superfamily protein